MDIIFGKVRIKVGDDYEGTSAIVTTEKGFTRTIQLVSPFVDVILPGLEEYTIEYQNGYKDTFTLSYGNMVISTAGGILLPFSTCTDEQLARMVELYYEDVFTLDDIKSVWSVGDRRTVHLNDMPADNGCAAILAQDIEIQILDFDKTELISPINGHNRALLIVDQVDCLTPPQYFGKGVATEPHTSPRLAWFTNSYIPALPDLLEPLVKNVLRYGATHDDRSNAGGLRGPYNARAFILESSEVDTNHTWGNNHYHYQQLKFYESAAHKIKGYGYKKALDVTYLWYLNVYYVNSSGTALHAVVNRSGSVSYSMIASGDLAGLAPAFCF